MPEPGIDFRAILHLLDEAGVRYVVIGGVAMHLHGANNLTVDMDISFDRALAGALGSQSSRYRGLPPDVPCVIDAQTLRNVTNLTLETDLGDFDLVAQLEGIDSFDDLIAMKNAADRAKDREHILQLKALNRLLSQGSGDASE